MLIRNTDKRYYDPDSCQNMDILGQFERVKWAEIMMLARAL
jgi:hypothetical protein